MNRIHVIARASDITDESVIPRGYKSVILDSQGNKMADLIAEGSNRIWVNLEQIPRHVQDTENINKNVDEYTDKYINILLWPTYTKDRNGYSKI